MGRFPTFENIDDSLGGLNAGTFSCLDRLSGQVGGDEDVVHDGVLAHTAAGDDFQRGSTSEHVSGDRFAGQNGTGGAVEERLTVGRCPQSAGR